MKHVELCFAVCCILGSVCLAGFDYSIVDAYEYGTVDLDSQSLLVLGSGAESIDARGSSYVEVRETAGPLDFGVSGIWTMHLSDSSSVKHLGGETGAMTLSDHATAILKGGRIDYISSRQYVLSPNQNYFPHIEIVCKVHDFDSSTKKLTGVWLDDSTFDIQLVDQSGYDPVIENIFFTPEPATLCMMGLGALLVRRRSDRM